MVGIGAAPEAIETDPIMYDYLFEASWVDVDIDTIGLHTHGINADSTSPVSGQQSTSAVVRKENAAPPDEDMIAWVRGWAMRRYASYGQDVPSELVDGWQALYQLGPYASSVIQQGPSGSIVAKDPGLNITRLSCCAPALPVGSVQVMLDVWKSIINIDPTSPIASKSTYLHDVADFGTQVLSNLAYGLQDELYHAVNTSNVTQLQIIAQEFLQIIKDIDTLASTQDQRLLGQWIQSARATAVTTPERPIPSTGASVVNAKPIYHTEYTNFDLDSFASSRTCDDAPAMNCGYGGINQSVCEGMGCCWNPVPNTPSCRMPVHQVEADQLEWNARTQITLWSTAGSGLNEYSYRLWGGLVGDYYYTRWQRWFDSVGSALQRGEVYDDKLAGAIADELKSYDQAWCLSTSGNYSTVPAGNVVVKAQEIYRRYF